MTHETHLELITDQALDSLLRRFKYQAPPEPPVLGMVTAARARTTAAPAVSALRLAGRVALAIAVVVVAMLGLQIAGTHLPHRAGQLTPLTQVNAAWAAADGYVLDFTVFDVDDDASLQHTPLTPNFDSFRLAALAWGKAHGLTVKAHKMLDSEPADRECGLVFEPTGWMRSGNRYATSTALISLRLADASAIDDLSRTLTALPGVCRPEAAQQTIYFDEGGITPALARLKVIINGQTYAFPQDFTPEEAQNLYWRCTSAKQTGVYFDAFSKYLLRKPDHDGRFALGDVVRSGFDTDGNYVITTVRQHWDPPVDKNFPLTDTFMKYGWSIYVPPSVDAASLDPLQELARRLQPLPMVVPPGTQTIDLVYWLVPKAPLFSQGGQSISAAQQAQATLLATALQQGLDAWIAAHPEAKNNLAWGDRVTGDTVPWRGAPLAFAIRLDNSNQTEAGSLEAQLAALPGVPAPEVGVRDLQPPLHIQPQ